MLDCFATAVKGDEPAIEVAGQFTIAQHFIGREEQLAWWITILRGRRLPGDRPTDGPKRESTGASGSDSN